MQPGMLISGTGHALVLSWALVSGWLDRTPRLEDVSVTEVTLLSGEEFDALQATPAALPVPSVTPEPKPAPTPEPDPAPEPAPEPAPTPEAETAEQAPAPDAATPAPVNDPGASPRPDPAVSASPAPAPRVAPVAAPRPDPAAAPDATLQEAARPAPTPETAQPVEALPEATAPPEAATEIVTEAEAAIGGTRGAVAPTRSIRPQTRPTRQAAISDALDDALQDAAAPAPEPEPQPEAQPDATASAPTGPPLTSGEKDALRVAVQQCWNVGALSSAALRVTVTVGVSMLADGRPDTASIRQVAAEGGSSDAVRQAYEAARRAIIRCGARGYDLPADKFDQWREIEMVFNPERMRIK